jgi:hypothetical protein
MVLKVNKVLSVIRALKVRQVITDHRVDKVLSATKVSRDRLVIMDHKENRVQLVIRE